MTIDEKRVPLMRNAILSALLVTMLGVGVLAAGELEPTAPPGPTMKSLDEIPPTWSQTLDSTDGELDGCNSSRFKCVLGGSAVLDNETGLIWERTPTNAYTQWLSSIDACLQKLVGDRGGWRLPRAEEIFSLIDLSSGLPRLPPSHPFTGLQDVACYYSYAWSENAGWLNAEPLGDGGACMRVLEGRAEGWIWSENVGWISLSRHNTGT